MKFVPVLSSVLAAVCVATSGLGASAQEVAGLSEEVGFLPVVGQEIKMTPALRRHLQTSGSSTTDAPTTTTPATTTATPTTTAPTPTTATSTTTAPTPTPTTATPTPTMDTPTATTATPEATTATPTATSETETPSSTTATPDATTTTPTTTTATPTATSATASSTTTDTTSSSATSTSTPTPTATESATTSNSGSASSAGASSDTSSGSSMSTGAVIGIVVGIVAGVAIIATIIMCVIRRRRETEDDPLSPFELSMDKGYNPTPGGFNAQNSYNPRVMGATAGASASGSMSNTRTPPADAVAAGVAYSQFYDNAATSPGSMNRLESNVDSVQTGPGNNPAATNGTNLWLSAMEPKDNDSYLSAQESPSSSRNSSRNSYEMSSGQNIDLDQSSQISGNSNKESDDFPDHHGDNDSARGSYEL